MPDQPDNLPKPATFDQVREGRPWWKACCAGCCLGILALVALILIAVRTFTGPGPKQVQTLPTNLPAQLALYRPEEAREIIHYPGTRKGLTSRLVTGPLRWLRSLSLQVVPEDAGGIASTSSAEQVLREISSRVSQLEGFDTLAMRWSNLNASRDEVLRFYTGSLKQAGIEQPKMRRDPPGTVSELIGESDDLRFSLVLIDEPNVSGIDSLSLVVEYRVRL